MAAPAYAVSIGEAVKILTFALAEAEAELPPHLRLSTDHWVAAKHGPDAWASVHAKVCTDRSTTPEVKTALLALKVAMECRSGLQGVLNEVELLGKPITIPKLGKQRPAGLAK